MRYRNRFIYLTRDFEVMDCDNWYDLDDDVDYQYHV